MNKVRIKSSEQSVVLLNKRGLFLSFFLCFVLNMSIRIAQERY